MVCMPCGHGKSRVCLALAARVGRVTLILMHMIGLVDQWIKVARECLPGARVGYIKADGIRVQDVDVVIASIFTLKSHIAGGEPYLAALFARVGFVILDEAHHGVANSFQYVMAHVPARHRLAVTATPRRKDSLFQELQFIFGPVVFRSFRRPGDGQVALLKFNSSVLREHVVWGRLRKDLMEDDMVGDPRRTALAVRVATLLAVSQRRRVVITTPRAAHVEVLRAALQRELEPHAATLSRTVRVFVSDAAPRKPRRRGTQTAEQVDTEHRAALYAWQDSGPHGRYEVVAAPLAGMVLESMKAPERELNYEACVVVATSRIMEEGISYDQWDTLLNLSDGVDPEQIVGRIQRAGEKKVPLVVDMWSPVSMYVAMRALRLKFYRGEQFHVHYVEASGEEDAPGEVFWRRFDRVASRVL